MRITRGPRLPGPDLSTHELTNHHTGCENPIEDRGVRPGRFTQYVNAWCNGSMGYRECTLGRHRASEGREFLSNPDDLLVPTIVALSPYFHAHATQSSLWMRM